MANQVMEQILMAHQLRMVPMDYQMVTIMDVEMAYTEELDQESTALRIVLKMEITTLGQVTTDTYLEDQMMEVTYPQVL